MILFVIHMIYKEKEKKKRPVTAHVPQTCEDFDCLRKKKIEMLITILHHRHVNTTTLGIAFHKSEGSKRK